MHLTTDRGVHQEERPRVSIGSLRDWDAARVFLEVARCGSFRSAAERLDLSINAVRRRVGDFERQIGATMFIRDVYGARLTEEGAHVMVAVERMEAASFDLLRSAKSSSEIRIAVTESLGTFWLAPRLAEFQRAFPNLLIDLHCATRSADVSRHEADIAIQLSRPEAPDVKAKKLGRLHLMFFASEQYLATHGTPKNVDDLLKHRLVIQLDDESTTAEALAALFPGRGQREPMVMKTNVSSANSWAIANGAGIGLFPTCAGLGGKMIPISVPAHLSFDIWLSYHPGSSRIPKVRNMVDWLVEAFNPAKYPWFKDEFLNPRELEAVYMGEPLTHLFGGL